MSILRLKENVENLSENSRKIILEQLPNEFIDAAGKRCVYHPKEKKYIIFDLKNDRIAAGGFGLVIKSCGEITINEKESNYQLNTQYVLKIQERNDDTSDFIQQEFEQSRKMSYLDMQKPIESETESNNETIPVYLSLMKKVGTTNLYIYLLKFYEIQNHLKQEDAEHFIKLSLDILYKLEELLHQRNIVHADIKPHNIMISRKKDIKGLASSRFIDFGLSYELNDSSERHTGGTKGYAAPENVRNKELPVNADIKKAMLKQTDAFAIGLTLYEIFNGIIEENTGEKLFRDPEEYKNLTFNLDELDESVQQPIEDTIKSLLDTNPETRFSISDAIDLLNIARINNKIIQEKIPDEQIASLWHAHNVARNARAELRKPEISPIKMYNIVVEALKNIPDEPLLLNEFIETTNIKILFGLDNKDKIHKKINETMEGFSAHILLFNLYDTEKLKMTHPALEKTIDEAQKIMQRAKFDNMDKFNKNEYGTKEYLFKILPELKQFDKLTIDIWKAKLKHKDDPLKFDILQAIESYMADTLNAKTIKTKDRAASTRRHNDIKNLLNIINKQPDENLPNLVAAYFKTPQFTTGFFLTNNSQLRDKVMKCFPDKQKKPPLTKIKPK